MNQLKNMRRFCSLILVAILLIGMLPLSAMAAEESVVVIAASDYQLSNSGTIMTNIMNQIKEDYGTPYGALLGGDYDAGSISTKASHIQAVDDVIDSVFPEIASDKRIYIQGNHENYAGLKVDGTNLMNYTGAYDTEYYGVYAFNHDDFPWSTSSNPSSSSTLVKATADALGDYLEAKVAEGYEKPIFVMSHLPLHAARNDNYYAKYIFDELEAAGEAGLNVIFLCGHNHSGGYDAYLGNGSFYLPVGSSLTVVDGKSGTYTDDSISFTYMNYGYLGKVGGSGGCTHQSMTVFEITADQVSIKRYDESGLHKLKAAGVASGSYTANTTEIGTEGAIIELGEPVPAVTVTNNNVTVTSAGLTGLTATKVFGTDSTDSYDAETYAAYASYDITPEGYTQGKSATVTITLDEADGFDTSKNVTLIDQEKGTEKKLTVADGAVTFTTNHFSTYDIAQKSPSAYYTYELVTSIEAGGEYVIVGNSDAVALMDANGSLGSQDVTISGTTLTSESELTEWTFSSATSGTITSSEGNKLGYSSSSWNLTGSGDCSFDIASGSGNFSLRVIRASSGYNRYYFNYDGSGWTSKPTSAAYVRLYQLTNEGSDTTDPEIPETPETPESGSDWIELPSGNTFELDTDGIDSGAKYLIVANSYEKALSAAAASGNAVDVSINGTEATADADYGWTITASGSGYTIQKDGTYLSRSSSSLASASSASVWTVGNSGSGSYTITQTGSGGWWGGNSSYYVRWSNSNGYFQASSYSTDPVRLYKYAGAGTGINAEYIRLGGEIQQAYTTADAVTVDTVLGKVMIETSADGVNADTAALAVTSDMVTWNDAFDGTTAGTYTGTVTCEGYSLGTITVSITAAEHNFETVTVEATCTEDGAITTKCTICGEETVEVIPATGHSYECVVTAATCGADGSKVYTCTKCEDTYTEVIPATGEHTTETVTVEATCTEDGSITTTCTVCGEESAETIEAKGHDYECVVTDATCGADGSKVYTCTVCNAFYTETIPATENHTYESVTVEATCTEAGSVTHTCAVCGHTYVEPIAALGHDYASVTTAPTCTEEGFTTYTCGTCGHSYTDGTTEALGHDYDSVITATCEEDGFVVYTCKTCGHSYNGDTVAAYGHSYEVTTVAPTCATAGYTTYVCTACGHTYTGDEVAALGHGYASVTVEATCTENGYTTYTCAVCDHSYVGDEVLALGHDYESVVTEPTFETEGYTTHTCRVCGDVKVDSFVPVLSHDYETVTVEASCTTDGSVTHTCVTCGYSYTETLPALGHSYTSVTTDATCTENGAIVSTCATCGYEETEVIPATGHSFETTVIDPTCSTVGYSTYTCACGHVVTEEIPALGHDYESQYVAPTCTETGGTTYTCTVCGHSYMDAEAALGHSYTTESVAPTCTEAGYTTYTCGTCGDSYTADETAALGHDYDAVVTVPTCTEEGFTTYTCTVCADSYTGNKTAALGHNYDSVVTEPTCTEGGYTSYTCTVCGHNYTGSETAALGHSYTCVESDGYLVYTCHCGHTYSEEIQGVTYTKVSSIANDNRYVITLYSGNKYYALSHEDNKISVAEITVSGDEITSEITEDLIWTYANSKLSYEDNGTTYYLYAQPASGWWSWWFAPTLTVSSSNSTDVSFSNNQLKLGYYALYYSNGSVSLNWNATTTYFFVEK